MAEKTVKINFLRNKVVEGVPVGPGYKTKLATVPESWANYFVAKGDAEKPESKKSSDKSEK